MTNTLLLRARMLAAAWACAVSAGAQDPGVAGAPLGAPSVQRTEITGAAQSGRLTRAIDWAEARMDGPSVVRDGFYPEMGGMIPGAGFSMGPG